MYAFINNTPFNLLRMKVKGPLHITHNEILSALKNHLGNKEFYDNEIVKQNISRERQLIWESISKSKLIDYQEISEKEFDINNPLIAIICMSRSNKERNTLYKYIKISSVQDDEMFYYIIDDGVNIVVTDIYKTKSESQIAVQPIIEHVNKLASELHQFNV